MKTDDPNLDAIVSNIVDMLDDEDPFPSAPFTVSSGDRPARTMEGCRLIRGPALPSTSSIDLSTLGAAQEKGSIVLVSNLEPKTTNRTLFDIFFPMGASEAEVLPPNGARRRTGLVVFPTRDMAIMAAQKMNDFVPHGQSQPLHAVYVPAGAGQNRTPTTVRDLLELRGARLDPSELAGLLIAEDASPGSALGAIQEALCSAHDSAFIPPLVEAFRLYADALPRDSPKALLRDLSKWVIQCIVSPREDVALRGACGAMCALFFHTGLIAGSPFALGLRLLQEAAGRQPDEGLVAALAAMNTTWYRHNDARTTQPGASEFAASFSAYAERSSTSLSDTSVGSGPCDRSGGHQRQSTEKFGNPMGNGRRPQSNRDSLACTVYITKVPPSIPHDQLCAFFRAFGELVKVRLYADGPSEAGATYRSCFGFVQFLKPSAARAIVDYCRNASTTPPATPNSSTGSASSADTAIAEVVKRMVPRAQLQVLHVMRVSFARSCIHDQDPTDATTDPITHAIVQPCTFGL